MVCLVVLVLVLVITYLVYSTRKPACYPPGPAWLPIVGNLPELRKLSKLLGGQHLALVELSNKYKTNVLGLKLGKDLVITVFSHHTVKQVLTGEEYEGRPDNFFIRLRSMGTRKGVTCTDGDLWNIQRNFLVKHLRSLGFGKSPMEFMITEELREVLHVIKANPDRVRVGKILAPSVLNVLWALTAGSRIPRTDPRLDRLLELLNSRSKAFDMSGGTLSQHPWLRYLAPERTGYNLLQKLNKELKELFMATIKEHYERWTEGRNDDIIYSFITEMKQAKDASTTFTDDQLVMICLDIFIAGSQTTSNTLDFAFMMMLLHPDVQQKAHAQLDDVLSCKNKDLEYADRHRMPYIEAVLMEVQRFCHVTPVCGPRRVLRDTQLENYIIPKETTVLISLYSIHQDPQYWKDPEVFRPERFLDNDGKLVYKDRLVPFGLGRRRCLGEILARQCLFLFFTGILREYRVVKVADDAPLPSGIPLPGITLTPEEYFVRFIKRC